MRATKKKLEELRWMSPEELIQRKEDLNKQMFEVRQQTVGMKGMNAGRPHMYKKIKKEIARIETIWKEKNFHLNQT